MENRQKQNFTTCLLQSNLCSVQQQIENALPHTPYLKACMHDASLTNYELIMRAALQSSVCVTTCLQFLFSPCLPELHRTGDR